jgi:hypothetical protein
LGPGQYRDRRREPTANPGSESYATSNSDSMQPAGNTNSYTDACVTYADTT